jgi:hypothetical protein
MAFPTITSLDSNGPLDELARFELLLSRATPTVRKRFLEAVVLGRRSAKLEDLSILIAQGRTNEAIAIADHLGPSTATALEAAYTAAGLSAAEVLRSQVDTFFDFNSLNRRAVREMQDSRVRLVRELASDQRNMATFVLSDGFDRGLAPVDMARELRQSIGLTSQQSQWVANYRTQLRGTAAQRRAALGRQLRDRRFDPTVRRSIAEGFDLTDEQIERMVDRYRERWVAFRAQTIAETETLAAVGAGDEELWRQAIEAGEVDPADVVNTWHTRGDSHVRNTHDGMNGQEKGFGEPFVTDAQVLIRYPGDPGVPAKERVKCRCVVARGVREEARTAA